MHYGYLLRGRVSGNVKIGIAGNVKERLYAYRTHCGEPITLRGTFRFENKNHARRWERLVLSTHLENKIHGEWISITEDKIQSIVDGKVGGVVSVEHKTRPLNENFLRLMNKTGGKPLVVKRRMAPGWLVMICICEGGRPVCQLYGADKWEQAMLAVALINQNFSPWWEDGFTRWPHHKQAAWLNEKFPKGWKYA